MNTEELAALSERYDFLEKKLAADVAVIRISAKFSSPSALKFLAIYCDTPLPRGHIKQLTSQPKPHDKGNIKT